MNRKETLKELESLSCKYDASKIGRRHNKLGALLNKLDDEIRAIERSEEYTHLKESWNFITTIEKNEDGRRKDIQSVELIGLLKEHLNQVERLYK